MKRQRVLAIGLDGFDVALAERLMAAGQMPALAQLRNRAARFPLDEGRDRRAGLSWENFASGLTPEATRRFHGLDFDPASYLMVGDGGLHAPWWANADVRVVVFDPPYVGLRRAPNTEGVVGWGAHNPGVAAAGRPPELLEELTQRFGAYPAADLMYEPPWPSATRTRLMGEALNLALEARSRATQWLAFERLPEWDFFFTVVSELHSAVEGLWHGVDSSHPLNNHPSAGAASAAMLELHHALDRMIGQLVNSAGDAAILAFNVGGMGPNTCDVPSMVLLPELLYRHAFGHPLLTIPPEWTAHPDCVPNIDENDTWDSVGRAWVPDPPAPAFEPTTTASRARRRIARLLPGPLRGLLKESQSTAAGKLSSDKPPGSGLDFIPANRYRRYWPQMPAFALPTFVDGRIRINLRGREKHGIIEPFHYEETCRTLETLLRECRDPRTGEPSVAAIERTSDANPMDLAPSDCDLLVDWNGAAVALEHPRLGLIGPVPIRRTGGHTRDGIAYLAATGLEAGERAVRSSADLAPTIAELLGIMPTGPVTGKSFLSAPVIAPCPTLP